MWDICCHLLSARHLFRSSHNTREVWAAVQTCVQKCPALQLPVTTPLASLQYDPPGHACQYGEPSGQIWPAKQGPPDSCSTRCNGGTTFSRGRVEIRNKDRQEPPRRVGGWVGRGGVP